jgi:hypothetical protein
MSNLTTGGAGSNDTPAKRSTRNKPFSPDDAEQVLFVTKKPTARGVITDEITKHYENAGLAGGVATSFDGVNEKFSASPAIDAPQTQMSGFAWGKSSGTGTHNLLGQYRSTGSNRSFSLALESGLFRVVVFGDSAVTLIKRYYSTVTFNDGLWHSFGFTFDNGVLKLWVDGAEIAVTKDLDGVMGSVYAQVDTTNSFLDIASEGTSDTFSGQLQFPAVWAGTALTAVEIANLYSKGKMPSTTPDAFYFLNGDQCFDLTDNGNHGTASNNPTKYSNADVPVMQNIGLDNAGWNWGNGGKLKDKKLIGGDVYVFKIKTTDEKFIILSGLNSAGGGAWAVVSQNGNSSDGLGDCSNLNIDGVDYTSLTRDEVHTLIADGQEHTLTITMNSGSHSDDYINWDCVRWNDYGTYLLETGYLRLISVNGVAPDVDESAAAINATNPGFNARIPARIDSTLDAQGAELVTYKGASNRNAQLKGGVASKFNGTNTKVKTPDLQVGSTDNLSVSTWVNFIESGRDLSNNNILIFQPAAGSYGWSLYGFNGTQLRFQSKKVGTGYNTEGINYADINDGNWHLITITNDTASDKLKVYFDGALQQEADAHSFARGSDYMAIGVNHNWNDGFLSGVLQSPMIWNDVALGENEVSSLYNGKLDEVTKPSYAWDLNGDIGYDVIDGTGALITANTPAVYSQDAVFWNAAKGFSWGNQGAVIHSPVNGDVWKFRVKTTDEKFIFSNGQSTTYWSMSADKDNANSAFSSATGVIIDGVSYTSLTADESFNLICDGVEHIVEIIHGNGVQNYANWTKTEWNNYHSTWLLEDGYLRLISINDEPVVIDQSATSSLWSSTEFNAQVPATWDKDIDAQGAPVTFPAGKFRNTNHTIQYNLDGETPQWQSNLYEGMLLDGASYLSYPVTSFNMAHPWELEAWVYRNNDNTLPLAASRLANKALNIQASDGRTQTNFGAGYSNLMTKIPSGEWTHVKYTFDGATSLRGVTKNISGIVTADVTRTGNFSGADTNNVTTIGVGGGSYCDGRIRDYKYSQTGLAIHLPLTENALDVSNAIAITETTSTTGITFSKTTISDLQFGSGVTFPQTLTEQSGISHSKIISFNPK